MYVPEPSCRLYSAKVHENRRSRFCISGTKGTINHLNSCGTGVRRECGGVQRQVKVSFWLGKNKFDTYIEIITKSNNYFLDLLSQFSSGGQNQPLSLFDVKVNSLHQSNRKRRSLSSTYKV